MKIKISTITDSSGKSYSYPSPGLNPGSAALTAVGGVLCGLLGVGIGGVDGSCLFYLTYLFEHFFLSYHVVLHDILFLINLLAVFVLAGTSDYLTIYNETCLLFLVMLCVLFR